VAGTDPLDCYEVSGGCSQFHLTVLIEMMHREEFGLKWDLPLSFTRRMKKRAILRDLKRVLRFVFQ
jgi:predicted membrane GTPase involved in stress response